MDHIERISADELRSGLDEAEGMKPTLRLVTAIAYKEGVSQTKLAEWFDVERKTIYHWLRRIDPDDIATSVTDDNRAGRPVKLSKQQCSKLNETLEGPPSSVGIDAESWTPELVRKFVQDAYDVSYSLPSCRRLMKQAGLQYRPDNGGWVTYGD